MKLFKKAILFVHGFAGGVYDAEYLDHRLELIYNFDVYAFTLPAHDGEPIKKIAYKDWIEKSESEVEFLLNNGYKTIYVVGHSMGGVIASYLASKYKEVKKLVLLAPAFSYLGYEDGKLNKIESIKKVPKLVEQYGIKRLTARMTKLPLNAANEFMKLVDEFRFCIKDVTVPTLIFQGKDDNVVPPNTPEFILKNIKSEDKKVIYLDGITHDILRENKKEEVTEEIIKFLKKW